MDRAQPRIELERRAFLRGLVFAAGGALSTSCASFVLEGGKPAPASRRLLGAAEREALAAAAEAVIPTTDTPGARAAGVPEFIEMMLVDWFEEDERAAFRTGLARLDALAGQRAGAPFAAAGEAVQHAVLGDLEREAAAAQQPGGASLLPGLLDGAIGPPRPFFAALRELCVVGYYTSEIGATQELARRVTGDYQSCVPFAALGRAWSE